VPNIIINIIALLVCCLQLLNFVVGWMDMVALRDTWFLQDVE
jgi:hypothetical protein